FTPGTYTLSLHDALPISLNRWSSSSTVSFSPSTEPSTSALAGDRALNRFHGRAQLTELSGQTGQGRVQPGDALGVLCALLEGGRSEEHTSELQSLRHLVC